MILKDNSCSIGRQSGEIWTGPMLLTRLLQPIFFKSAALPVCQKYRLLKYIPANYSRFDVCVGTENRIGS